jgi:hypothetical protein
MDTGFGDSDRLLLHDLVDGDTVDVRHLVEFVDADDPSVGEDHRSGFESSFAWKRVRCEVGKRRGEMERGR